MIALPNLQKIKIDGWKWLALSVFEWTTLEKRKPENKNEMIPFVAKYCDFLVSLKTYLHQGKTWYALSVLKRTPTLGRLSLISDVSHCCAGSLEWEGACVRARNVCHKGPFTHAISDAISRTKRSLPYPARMLFSRSIAWIGKKVVTYYLKTPFFHISASLAVFCRSVTRLNPVRGRLGQILCAKSHQNRMCKRP